MGVLHSHLKTLVMLLLWNLCLCTNLVRSRRKSDLILNDHVDRFLNLDFENVYNDLRFRRSTNTNETKEISEQEYILLNNSKENKTEDEFGSIVKEDTTVDYDMFNYTDEPCVGDPEFCNMTKEEYMEMLNEYIFPHPYEWVLIATHAIVFVIGLIGNALVCIAVYRNHSMRTVTNYFIVNLAVADFMVILICLPPTVLWDVTETWFFGTAMCRIVLYFQVSSIFPLFLMMIAYCQIVRVLWRSDNIPGHTESHKLCTTPSGQNNWLAANRRTTPSIHANASTEGQLRSRRKAAKMLVAVVVMFAVCYFPVHLLSVLSSQLPYFPKNVSFVAGKFRREFHRSYFKCLCCCLSSSAPDQNGTSFAPIGSSRAGTTRTVVRRNDSCVSYRLTHLSPSNHNSIHRDFVRNTNTSFIEQINGRRPKVRDDSISESATRFTLTTDVGKD
ncbi:hypothetical protein ABMA28_009498 [Loxostege sticticalis]|uniref:G-protein coupled receptors family 1 profile domain-containing protein n=1 Tax=Loxostege sticticalis TaxID=481309 RepID=A0ABD0SDJ6_LOXSC